MKKTAPSLLIILSVALCTLAACNAKKLNAKAEETATAFYTDLQKKDFQSAVSLCSDKGFTGDSKKGWIKSMERNSTLLGEVKSFSKTNGFNIATSTSSGTTVAFTYDVQWQFGKSQDSIYFIKEKDGSMKIYRYVWLHKDADYMIGMDNSEKESGLYMDALKSSDYEAATALCAKEALNITPKEKWASFLDNAVSKLGNVSAYTVLRDSSRYHIDAEGDAGKGNYYDILVRSQRTRGDVMEKLVFFQKDYTKPVKLAGHFFL